MDLNSMCPVCYFPLSSPGCARIQIPTEWTNGCWDFAIICCGCQTCCVINEPASDRNVARLDTGLNAYCDCNQDWTVLFSLTLETIPGNLNAGNIMITCSRCGSKQFFMNYMFSSNVSASAPIAPNKPARDISFVNNPMDERFVDYGNKNVPGFNPAQVLTEDGNSSQNSVFNYTCRGSDSSTDDRNDFLSPPPIGFKFAAVTQPNYSNLCSSTITQSIPENYQSPPCIPQPMPQPYPPFPPLSSPGLPYAAHSTPYPNYEQSLPLYPSMPGFASTVPPQEDRTSDNSSGWGNSSLNSPLPVIPVPYPVHSTFSNNTVDSCGTNNENPPPATMNDFGGQGDNGRTKGLLSYLGAGITGADVALELWKKTLIESANLPCSCKDCPNPALKQTFFNENGVVSHVLCTTCGARTNWTISSTARTTPKTLITDLSVLEPADHVAWHRPCGIWHHAIVFNIDLNANKIEVIHYNGGIQKFDGAFASVRREWTHVKLIDQNFYRMDYEPGEIYPREVTLSKALQRLDEAAYNPFTRNCEHFARWCKTGHPRCLQIERIPVRVLKATDKLIHRIAEHEWFLRGKAAITQQAHEVKENITTSWQNDDDIKFRTRTASERDISDNNTKTKVNIQRSSDVTDYRVDTPESGRSISSSRSDNRFDKIADKAHTNIGSAKKYLTQVDLGPAKRYLAGKAGTLSDSLSRKLNM